MVAKYNTLKYLKILIKFTFFGMLSSTKNKQTPKRNSVKVDTTLIEKENQIANPDKIGGSCRTILSARSYTTNCMNIIFNPQYTD